MENQISIYPLNSHRLSILDLGGLTNETITAAKKAINAIGPLGTVALDLFVEADSIFRSKLITVKTNPLTKQITEFDKLRDDSFWEIKRTAKTAAKSSAFDKAEAGKLLAVFLKPYNNLAKEPIMSETSAINYLQTQFDTNTALKDAANTLQLNDVFNTLFTANEKVSVLWNDRAIDEAVKGGPSPSSLKNNLEKAYHDFCTVILQTTKLQPTPELETLLSVMNEIRIKYAKFLPVKLTNANTMVDAIPTQKYTGKEITPITRVFFKKENEDFNELRFTVDFYFTYKNNVKVGEAQIIIHGKGKYAGSYTSTFHIEREK